MKLRRPQPPDWARAPALSSVLEDMPPRQSAERIRNFIFLPETYPIPAGPGAHWRLQSGGGLSRHRLTAARTKS